MALTAGSEIALFMQADRELSYSDIESALVDAGFTNYSIARNFNGGMTDIQLNIRSNDRDENGNPQPLDAAASLSALTEAVTELSSTVPS